MDDFYARHGIRPGEIVVEIDNEHLNVYEEEERDPYDPYNPAKVKRTTRKEISGNRNQHFPPVETRKNGTNWIRSRRVLNRDGARLRATYDGALLGIEYIPGERIHLDTDKRIGRITDGCFDPENSELLDKLVRASGKMEKSMKFPLSPSEYVEVQLKSDTELWNWIYHMRMICNGDREHNAGVSRNPGCATEGPRLCRPIQNVDLLPTFEECCKSGKVKLELGFLGTPSDIKAFHDEFKENDPDYAGRLDTANGVITLTPYLGGLKKEEPEFAGT